MISNSDAKSTRPDGSSLFTLREWYRKQYLKTVWWEERRRAALEASGFQCEACPSNGVLHVHHLTYHRLFEELPEDLMCLCDKCHKIAHDPEFEKKTRGMEVAEKKKMVIKHCSKKNTSIPSMTFKIPPLGNRRHK